MSSLLYGQKLDPRLFELTNGVEIDKRLWAEELQVQKAWVVMLGAAKKVSPDEEAKLLKALDEAEAMLKAGTFEWRSSDEDIHVNIERFVSEKLGELGKKLHQGRSRNDLIATTLRLSVAANLDKTLLGIKELEKVFLKKAEEFSEVLFPGLTHMQYAQPIRLSHYFRSYVEMLKRDEENCIETKTTALKNMPLGAGAFAGTTMDLDFSIAAKKLGFQNQCANSLDAVGDRDFIIKALFALSNLALHMSRFSEDFIYWTSSCVGALKLPANYSTGSSMMPNKRNPDVLELCRAKSAHVMGALSNAMFLVKALPSSYSSDFHELKQAYIRAFDETYLMLEHFPRLVEGIEVDQKRSSELLVDAESKGLLATDYADELVEKGLSFREAYLKVSELVRDPEFNQKRKEFNTTSKDAVKKRNKAGGTSA